MSGEEFPLLVGPEIVVSQLKAKVPAPDYYHVRLYLSQEELCHDCHDLTTGMVLQAVVEPCNLGALLVNSGQLSLLYKPRAMFKLSARASCALEVLGKTGD